VKRETWKTSDGQKMSVTRWLALASGKAETFYTRDRKKRPAWNGVDECRVPTPFDLAPDSNAPSCFGCALPPPHEHVDGCRKPHRHCSCGNVIDLDHGFCDDCFAALIRGAAMTEAQSEKRRVQREAWLERYGFIEFSAGEVRITR
jgi:hypothetical protein